MIAAVPGYRYHKVQLRGFAGLSKGGNGDGYVAAPVAEEIARYIAERRLGPVAVIGHSMGGTMGMMLAARHPGRVSKLMVVDMFPYMGAMFGGPQATPETLKPIADRIMTGMRTSPADAYAKQLEGTIAGMVATEAMRPGALDDAMKSDRDVSARSYGELIMTDLRPELAKVTAKTIVLYVTPKGAPITDAQMDGYYTASYATLKGVTLKRVPASAHFVMWDNAPFFQREVKAFLAS
jgi:pimeloyl-ACP methyl ester carboxylesterase